MQFERKLARPAGSGLGTHHFKRLVELHAARFIEVKRPGTTIIVRLPKTKQVNLA